jgi:hypothetical protein
MILIGVALLVAAQHWLGALTVPEWLFVVLALDSLCSRSRRWCTSSVTPLRLSGSLGVQRT